MGVQNWVEIEPVKILTHISNLKIVCFLKKKNSKKVLNTNLKSIQHHKTIGKVLGASQVNQIKFFIQMCSKSNKLTIKGF